MAGGRCWLHSALSPSNRSPELRGKMPERYVLIYHAFGRLIGSQGYYCHLTRNKKVLFVCYRLSGITTYLVKCILLFDCDLIIKKVAYSISLGIF